MYISQPRAQNFYQNWMYFVTLVNDGRQSVRMVHGYDVWMSLTIVIYILTSVLVAFLDKKKGFFGKKNVFPVESLIFLEKINQIFNTTKWKKKP